MTKRNDKTQASVCCWNFNNVWIWSSQVSWFHYFHHQETAIVDAASFLFLLLAPATAMLPSCTWWFIANIYYIFLWSPLCYCCCCHAAWQQHSAPTLQASTQPLLCKPVPVPAFFCLNVAIAIAIDFSLCCLESILTVIAAECMASLWVLLADATGWLFPFEFLFLFGPLLEMWQMLHSTVPWWQCALLVLHFQLLPLPFNCCLILYFSCCCCFSPLTAWQNSKLMPLLLHGMLMLSTILKRLCCCRYLLQGCHFSLPLCHDPVVIVILMLAATVAMTVAIGNVAGWYHCHCAVAIAITVTIAIAITITVAIAIPSPTPSPLVDCCLNILF